MKLLTSLSFFAISFLPFYASAKTPAAVVDTVALNQAAPDFNLKDFSGKTVSLAALKGKVVILDFWATWCVPCHENFPAMKQITDHYKADADVVFLFIDTREKAPNYIQLAKADMKKHNYDFHVIFDEPGTDGKQNKYYNTLGMLGIPTQFIIDRQGIIRYKFVGFDSRLTDQEKMANSVKLIDGLKASL
ncbi:TlpA family protein disulfide reductase [Mucilaginibacter jinjuensis]|uniref:TlpA disulfide reductase family protein n=1 Tax=Mucilaginibacter jinjuensis TaxID=1176721 RepID=A0ABY7TF54_9SPHI|nr:TlpA disulfide reductase family protein [Mucilaginibacter jinjuensis]WCT14363.1 TlpA disulfide reductase family protein [Mucilaginibacter jinjuensis]